MADKKESFKVLGCGLPRTGTMSLKHALQILYNGPCMHGFEWADNIYDVNKVLDNIEDDKIFKDFFEDRRYVGSTDVPFCYHYEKIMKVYPDAKFVLTTRNPDNWVKSIKISVCKFTGRNSLFSRFPYNFALNFCLRFINPSFYNWHYYTKTKFKMLVDLTAAVEDGNGVDYYEKWLNDVKAVIPKEKLLVFHVGEGWEPLCKFLELPVPDVPFPNMNDKLAMKRMENYAKFLSWFSLAGYLLAPVAGALVAKHYQYW